MTRVKGMKPIFKPAKNTRYLIGQVDEAAALADLKLYNQHRLRVFNAERAIDADPPMLHPHNYLKISKLVADARRLIDIDLKNKQLVQKINTINRTKGKVESYYPKAYADSSKWKNQIMRMRRIETDNRMLYNMIKTAESGYSRAYHAKCWKKIMQKMRETCKFPLTIMDNQVDKIIEAMPSLTDCHRACWNPRCFFDFRVHDGASLGRIVIELYIDYVPKTVQNFMALCQGTEDGRTYKNCHVYKILPQRYFELGDITRNCGKGGLAAYEKEFKEENYVLKHTRPGVVSMVRNEKQRNNSKFMITFREDPYLDGRQVAFGKVVHGLDVVFGMEGMTRKFGKPMPPIFVENCGILYSDDSAKKISHRNKKNAMVKNKKSKKIKHNTEKEHEVVQKSKT